MNINFEIPMRRAFTFHVEGMCIKRTVEADTYSLARVAVWNTLTDEQRNGVVQMECVEEVDLTGGEE